jgi:hypothetical protein
MQRDILIEPKSAEAQRWHIDMAVMVDANPLAKEVGGIRVCVEKDRNYYTRQAGHGT